MQFYYLRLDTRFKPGSQAYATVFLIVGGCDNKIEFDDHLRIKNNNTIPSRKYIAMPLSCVKKVFGYLLTDYASWLNNPPSI
jgi:hypothetical protein